MIGNLADGLAFGDPQGHICAGGSGATFGYCRMLRLSYRGKSRQKTVTMPNWAFGLMAAGSAALGIALFLVISTIAVLLLPLVLAAGAVTAFVMRKRIERLLSGAGRARPQPASGRKRAPRKPLPGEIEDVEYRVVSEPQREPQQK